MLDKVHMLGLHRMTPGRGLGWTEATVILAATWDWQRHECFCVRDRHESSPRWLLLGGCRPLVVAAIASRGSAKQQTLI